MGAFLYATNACALSLYIDSNTSPDRSVVRLRRAPPKYREKVLVLRVYLRLPVRICGLLAEYRQLWVRTWGSQSLAGLKVVLLFPTIPTFSSSSYFFSYFFLKSSYYSYFFAVKCQNDDWSQEKPR